MKSAWIAGWLASAVWVGAAAAQAGPCTGEISDLQVAFDAKLKAAAAAGPDAAESSAARLHRQPTPKSLAHAEEALGEISRENMQAFARALKRAREADAASDKPACEGALDEARRALSQ